MELIQNIDNNVLEFIQTNMHSMILDHIMPVITRLGNGGVVWIVIALALLINKSYRKSGMLLIGSLLLCVLIGDIILKPLVGRIRPCYINTATPLLIPRPTDFSFPSGHTMSSFSAASVIFYSNRKWGIAAFILAALISFSRLYLNVHYPSDIIGGIVIGVLASIVTIRLFNSGYAKE